MNQQVRQETPGNEAGGTTLEDILPGLPDPSDLEVDPDIAAIDTSGHEDLADADAAADEPKVAPVANPKEEDDARQYGWVDKAAWVASGKPEKQWRSATEFNEFRAQATPILAKENKQLRERLERLERDQEVRAQVEADARRNIQKESLTLKLRQAREENDWDAADKIAEELLDIRIEEKARPKPEQAANPKAAEEFQSFLGSNTIYKTDESLQEALAVEVRSLIQVRGTNDPAGVLAKANERVRRMYPEKFAKPNHSMADGDGGGGGGDSAPTLGWGDLKPDVRRQYENMLGGGVTKEGLLKRLRQYPNVYFGRR